jgi:hypothetical protein
LKPDRHAKNSVNEWGGKLEDYIAIHETIDSSKSAHADMRHRAVLHSAFGIYLIEQIFARNVVTPDGEPARVTWITNSDGARVHIRDIAEKHVLEDLGRIPSLGDYLNNMQLQPWMGGRPRKERRI